jgi:hypothetical protein
MDWQDVVSALVPIHKTLRRLAVLLLTVYPVVTGGGTSIVSLQDFKTLEELTIGQDTIYRGRTPGEPLPGGLAGFLPRSIVRLHISHLERRFDKDLVDLARDARERLPDLSAVKVSWRKYATKIWPEELVRVALQERFREAGIVLSWRE